MHFILCCFQFSFAFHMFFPFDLLSQPHKKDFMNDLNLKLHLLLIVLFILMAFRLPSYLIEYLGILEYSLKLKFPLFLLIKFHFFGWMKDKD